MNNRITFPLSRVMSQTKKRILFFCPTIPDRNGIGLQRRAWAHLVTLKELGDVYAFILLTREQKIAHEGNKQSFDESASMCKRIEILELRRVPRVAPGSLIGLSLARFIFQFGKSNSHLTDILRPNNLATDIILGEFALIFFFRLSTFSALYEPLKLRNLDSNIFVDFDDVESVSQARDLALNKSQYGLEAGIIKRLEIRELQLWEHRALRTAQCVGVCSDLDSDRLRVRVRKAKVLVVPNALPVCNPVPQKGISETATLLLIGALGYGPNEDAAFYFHNHIHPILKQMVKVKTRLLLVGRSPSKALMCLQTDDSVAIHADVPDVVPYYQMADVVIVPIRHGGGTRIKILEALVMGRPIVSTSIGAEGLGLANGQHILIADSPQEFATACARLINDTDLRGRLVGEGRKVFSERFHEGIVREKLLSELARLI